MFTVDIPDLPQQYASVMVAQANQAQPAASNKERALGTCFAIDYNWSGKGWSGISPNVVARDYFYLYENRTIEVPPITSAELVTPPKHGKVFYSLEKDGSSYPNYMPDQGYIGDDKITFKVNVDGTIVKVVMLIKVTDKGADTEGLQESICKKTGNFWKISQDANGNPILTAVNYPSPFTGNTDSSSTDTATLASTLGSSILSTLAGEATGVTVNLADLPGAAIGQTTGSTVTLDANAAGNGWFIDTTPADNSEYLPTSNPNEWVAKAGSAAAGKMDMLSVLLHEYGHALGINHSADPNNFMGTTLTAGVRRLPSAEEMVLMQQLIGQAKEALTPTPLPLAGEGQNAPTFPTLPLGTSFIGFLGLLRSSRYGGVSIAPDASTLVTQYDWAANATLVNGSQTRLSQVFMLNPTDRFLSFTLAGTALDDLTGAPDDAFEVALLDANTGASLLSGTGQTRTDAILNLQADGTQNMANCVTCTTNPDGSRTYRVDLAGVPAGVAANLSFDLIGFGQNNSHVTVRDVRLSGLPQLHDETATLLEDGTLAFDPFAQVDNAAVLQLGSHVIDQPAHGAVTLNADGTFVYTPAADYFGADSFTYRLNDGPLESNLATVSIILTPVNDAPVVADVQATTVEDTALVIALGAYATDVDSNTLTTQIVTGPVHGVLTQNADGSFIYTPDLNFNGVDSFTCKVNVGALDSNIATVMLAVAAVTTLRERDQARLIS